MPLVDTTCAPRRLFVGVLVLLGLSCRAAIAQPMDFIDLGVRDAGEVFEVPVRLAHHRAVQWYRIELPATGPADHPGGFIDVWAMPTFIGGFLRAGAHALFDANGNRVATGRGVSDRWLAVYQMSFGSADPRSPIPVPPVDEPEFPNPPFSGQDGQLTAGVYWVAIANYATFGLTGWAAGSNANDGARDELETVLYFNIQPTGIPYCDGDFNWDGSADQDDVMYLANVLTGGENPTGRWADFNRDGSADQDDLLALVHTIAGGGCP